MLIKIVSGIFVIATVFALGIAGLDHWRNQDFAKVSLRQGDAQTPPSPAATQPTPDVPPPKPEPEKKEANAESSPPANETIVTKKTDRLPVSGESVQEVKVPLPVETSEDKGATPRCTAIFSRDSEGRGSFYSPC